MADIACAHLEPVHDFRFTVSFPALKDAAGIAVDEMPPIGGGTAPNPATLLATAVGSCLAASLTFCLKRARVEAPAVSADAVAHIERNAAGRLRIQGIDVKLSIAISENDETRLQRCEALFEDFCIVTESVRQGIPVSVELTPIPTEAQVAGVGC